MRFPENDIKSIVVFRALQLGDLLCSVPAFRALRAGYPSAQITLTGMPWMKMLPERFPAYFDEFIWFPGYPGLPEQELNVEKTIGFLQHIAGRKFDLAIQMQGNGSVVNPLVELFGAADTAGFYRKEDYFPGPAFMEYPTGIAEIHRHLKLMEHLDIPAASDELEFPILRTDYEDLNNALPGIADKKYICVHPGSRGGWRQWPPEHFALMADECHELGFEIVITGTPDELPIVAIMSNSMRSTPVIAAGKTSLGAMAALLQQSSGLISNCTGVSHIAAALKIKSVVISMDGEPERWAPLNTRIHHTIDWTKTNDIQIVRQAVRELFATAA